MENWSILVVLFNAIIRPFWMTSYRLLDKQEVRQSIKQSFRNVDISYITSKKNQTFYFWRLILEHFLSRFEQISDKNFGHFAET